MFDDVTYLAYIHTYIHIAANKFSQLVRSIYTINKREYLHTYILKHIHIYMLDKLYIYE